MVRERAFLYDAFVLRHDRCEKQFEYDKRGGNPKINRYYRAEKQQSRGGLPQGADTSPVGVKSSLHPSALTYTYILPEKEKT